MDEQDKIQAQIVALLNAQSALMKQDPPDPDAYREIESLISDLQYRLLALSSGVEIPALSVEQVATLQSAVKVLSDAVTASAGATQILQAATALANG
jgi:hypothetical protein